MTVIYLFIFLLGLKKQLIHDDFSLSEQLIGVETRIPSRISQLFPAKGHYFLLPKEGELKMF